MPFCNATVAEVYRQVDSVFRQSYPGVIRVLVLDNGSESPAVYHELRERLYNETLPLNRTITIFRNTTTEELPKSISATLVATQYELCLGIGEELPQDSFRDKIH